MSKRSFRRCSDPGMRHSSATDIPRNCASSCRLMCPVARVCDAQIAHETVNVTSLIQIDVEHLHMLSAAKAAAPAGALQVACASVMQ